MHFLKLKRAAVAAAFSITALTLSGCGGSGKPEALPTVELSVWCPEEEKELLSKMIDSFQAAHKDEATFRITVSAESEETCKAAVLSAPQNAADVYAFAADQFESLRQGGALLPVTRNAEQVIQNNGGADSGAIAGASHDGVLYAYPKTASNGYFLYYNSDYYTEEDVRSFDRLLEVAEQNGKKVSMDFTSGWYIYSFFKGAGLNVDRNEDGVTNSCDWNSRTTPIRGVDVVEAMLRIASSEAFLNGPDEAFQKGVADGSIIAGVNGAWNASRVEKAWGEGYAAAALPSYTVAGEEIRMHSFSSYKYIGVNAHTDQPDWAMQFAEWITNENNQLLRFQALGEGPSNVRAAASPEVQAAPALAALASQSEYSHPENVAEPFWTPAYMLGTVIVSGNGDGRNLQELLDEITADITAPPKPAASEQQ